MAKFKPGIPEGFSLDIEPVRDLGDYLDEPRPSPIAAKRAKPLHEPDVSATVEPPAAKTAAFEPPPVVRQEVKEPRPDTTATPRQVMPPSAPQPVLRSEPVSEDRAQRAKAPRREISMTPETLRMSDELLDLIRSGSGQRDTKANELFHALVLLVHEVKDEIDLHSIPKRGRWGSPTARAYPLELKNAFLQALLRRNSGAESDDGLVPFPLSHAG